MSFIAAAAAAGTTVAAMQAAAIAGATAAQVAAATTAAATASALASTAAAASLPSAAMLSTGAATGIAPGVVAPLIPAVIPTAAGIGGAMPTAAALAEGAATGIAPGVAPGGLGALPTTVATTAVPALAEQSFSQATKQTAKTAGKEVAGASKEKLTAGNERFLRNSVAGEIPTGGMTVAPAPAPSNLVSVTPPKTPTLPQASPRTGSTYVRPADMGKAPTSPLKTFDTPIKTELSPFNMSGGVGGIDESMNAAAQRAASADTFGGVGTAYQPAITKAPVEKSFLDKALGKAGDFAMDNKMELVLGGLGLAQMMPPSSGVNPISETMIRPYTYSEEDTSDQEADPSGREKIRYSSSYAAGTPYKAAQGGLLSLHRGGNFLSGRGDGMSDDIPAMIGTKQPARLADGEFVIPADVVSHIGNGSSKAGAEKLYAMMDKIRKERTGRKRQSPQINAAKYLPR
jgi:hypothetical protein